MRRLLWALPALLILLVPILLSQAQSAPPSQLTQTLDQGQSDDILCLDGSVPTVLSMDTASHAVIGCTDPATPTTVATTSPTVATPIPAPLGADGLHVVGNQIVSAQGKPVRLLGVDRSGLEYQCIHNFGMTDGPMDDAAVSVMASWRMTAVRVPLNEDCWLGINSAPAQYSGLTYRTYVSDYINLLASHGIIAILDLHWNAPGTEQATNQEPMADADHAPAFWTSVAITFKDRPNMVVFDLYNEPASAGGGGPSWQCWRDGGCLVPDTIANNGATFQAAGMQQMVDAVRNTGASNLLLLGGLGYASDLSSWLPSRPTDPRNNLAASWHSYQGNGCSTPDCWTTQVAPVAQQVPVVADEIGEQDCAHDYLDQVMGFLDQYRQSYLAWGWYAGSCQGSYQLISDWAGVPNNYGVGLQQRLLSIGQATPTPTATAIPPTATPSPLTPTLAATPTPQPRSKPQPAPQSKPATSPVPKR